MSSRIIRTAARVKNNTGVFRKGENFEQTVMQSSLLKEKLVGLGKCLLSPFRLEDAAQTADVQLQSNAPLPCVSETGGRRKGRRPI